MAPGAITMQRKSVSKSLLVVVGVATLWAASGASAVAQTENRALEVVNTREEALLARDTEAVVATFADDATVRSSSGRNLTGTDEIRGWVQDQVERGQIEVAGRRQVFGERMSWTATTSRDDWQQLGVSPLQVIQEVVVRDGRIVSMVNTLTPESAARLEAARARAAAGAPVEMPSQVPDTPSAERSEPAPASGDACSKVSDLLSGQPTRHIYEVTEVSL
jgi:hypothetical protein